MKISSEALYSSLGLIAILILLVRVVQVTSAQIRLLATLNLTGEQQRYWTQDGSICSRITSKLLIAPLINKRHNREVQLSKAVNVGTIPSRLHSLFLCFYLLTNVLYCSLLDYRHQPRAALLAEARGRTGHLAVMNMLPLFLFAARNNPFIPLLGISFDTFNLFHRWIGRVVVVEALAHTFIWGVNNYDALGLPGLLQHLRNDVFLLYGLISIATMLIIVIQSVSVIRHAFYESFLHIHQFLVVTAVGGLLLHCQNQSLPQKPFVYALISLWMLERLTRLFRIFQRRGTTVHVEALDGGACRLTFNIRGTWTKAPGSHVYVYIPAVSLWMSHPFSVAWVDHHSTREISSGSPKPNGHALTSPLSNDSEADFKTLPGNTRTAISCIVACRTGMTRTLYRKARRSTTGIISLSAFVEGPYGGLENMRSYGTVMLFAGGAGITHQLSHVKDLVEAFSDGTCATRKVILVWSMRSFEQLEWVQPWMDELIQMSRRGLCLKILFYVTRPCYDVDAEGAAEKSRSCSGHVSFGRVDVGDLVEREFRERVGAMCVGVCGPGGLADDVRAASRAVMSRGKVDFWEESFTW